MNKIKITKIEDFTIPSKYMRYKGLNTDIKEVSNNLKIGGKIIFMSITTGILLLIVLIVISIFTD